MEKPPKKLYSDQEDVWNKAEKFLKNLLNDSKTVKEAHVWASLAEGKFGVYERPYKDQIGSDIDFVIVMNEPADIPKNWKFADFGTAWFDLYKLGDFEYQNNKHQIDGLIVFPSKHNVDRMKERLKGMSKKIV